MTMIVSSRTQQDVTVVNIDKNKIKEIIVNFPSKHLFVQSEQQKL